MKERILKFLMVIAVIAMGVCFVKFDTMNVQAAEKRLQGGRSRSSAKSVSSKNNYIVKVNGDDQTMWYKFKTPNYQTYASLYAKNLSTSGSFSISLYSKYNEELLYDNYIYKNGYSYKGYEYPMKKNTWYYIVLKNNYGSGNVKFSLELNKDSIADTMSHAHGIKIKKKYISSIDGDSDEDWFKFKPSKSGTYTFNLRNLSNDGWIYGYVVTKYEEELDYCSAYKGSSGSFSVKLKKNQWYYIKIKSGSYWGGKYRISIT